MWRGYQFDQFGDASVVRCARARTSFELVLSHLDQLLQSMSGGECRSNAAVSLGLSHYGDVHDCPSPCTDKVSNSISNVRF
jgi:hypothetical protein